MIEHQIVDTEDEIKFLFGELKMSVRTHPMFTDSEGRLVDTIEDADKNGPEACFAKDFTNNYNEISKNFREFARLKELCKLQYMGIFIKNYKKHLIESEQKLLADDYKINQIYEEKRSELESKIENILNEIKQKVSYSVSDAEVSAVNQALNSSFNFYEFNLVENWLKYGGRYKNELIDALASKKELTKFEIRDLIQKQFRSRELNDKVEDLKRTSKEVLKESYLSWPDKTEWVPSLFRNKNLESAMNFIYGGVLLQPHLKETKLNGNSYTRFEINQTQLLENRISHSRQQTERYQLNLAQSPSSTLTTTSGWSGDLYQMKRKMIEYKWDIKNFAQANLGVYNKATNKHEFDSNASMKFESQFKLLSSHICEKSDSNILLRQVTRDEARKEFNIKRASLIKEWEKHWGCPWPKTEAGNYYEAHHIIPLDKFPCNKWFNIMPLTLKQHRGPGKTGSIHHGSHLNDIEEFLDFQRDTYNKDYKKK